MAGATGTVMLYDTFTSGQLDKAKWDQFVTCWGGGVTIWLLPTQWKYGAWPLSGEIDMIEARGNVDLKDWQGHFQGLNTLYSTIHFGPAWNQKQSPGHWKHASSGTWGDAFHTYAMDWTADHIRLEVDGETIFQQTTPPGGYWNGGFHGENVWSAGQRDAPFDQEFRLILNVAVGGEFFQEEWINKDYPQPWTRHSRHADRMASFWANKDKWGTNGDDSAMRIRSVKMIQY